tara:strand:- start:1685 stop:2248 length:564 start_codon:yes stop_codon:yes gene_type:complete
MIHESTYVDQNVRIGDNTKIWHFCHISDGVKIGKNCTIGQNVFIGKNVEIGNNVKIQNNVSVFEGVTLENNVFCGPSVVFTNVINPRSGIEKKNEFKKTLIKHGASIGANATIVCGYSLGVYSFIGAGTLVKKDVLDYAVEVGNPSKHIGWMDEYGNKIDLPIKGNGNFTSQNKHIYILKKGILQKK